MSGTPGDIMDWAGADMSNIRVLILALVGVSAVMLALVAGAGRSYRLHRLRTGIRKVVLAGCGLSALLNALGFAILAAPLEQDFYFLVAASLLAAGSLLLFASAAYALGGIASWLATPKSVREVLATVPEALPRSDRADMSVLGTAVRADYGIALAGGGIRSASMALGALQVLERDNEPGDPMGWGVASKVTAISGGSNMAAGWSISRSARTGPSCARIDGQPKAWAEDSDDKDSPEERHLRRNLSYLLNPEALGEDPGMPSGGNDEPERDGKVEPEAGKTKPPRVVTPAVAVTVLVGLLINVAVLLAIMWIVTRPLGWLYRSLAGLTAEDDSEASREKIEQLVGSTAMWVPPTAWAALGVLALVLWVIFGKVRAVQQPLLLSSTRGLAYGALAIGAALCVALVLFPKLMVFVGGLDGTDITIGSLAAGVASYGAVVRVLQQPLAKYAATVGGVAFFIAVTMVGAAWTYDAALQGPRGEHAWLPGHGWVRWIVVVGFVLVIWLFISPERWSLGPFYRGKLRQAFATYTTSTDPDGGRTVKAYRNDTAIDKSAEKEPELHKFGDEQGVTTPLTICAASTVSNRSVRTHQGIPAVSVTFDPQRITLHVPLNKEGSWGEWSTTSRKMDELLAGRPRMTTMFASAMSSAAVAPAMGRVRLAGPTRMLLTFANVRTGAWLPNPRYATKLDPERLRKGKLRRTRLAYLLKEALGIFDLSDLYIYVADGGHWENSGIVELLRDGTRREIVCIDADMGPGDTTSTVAKAIELARLESGTKIFMDLDPLRAAPTSGHAPGYSARTVNLGFFERTNEKAKDSTIGLLWYAKPGLVAGMPAPLLAHREIYPDFPRTSTSDQFFDVSTFTAYRDLGRYNARVIRRARFDLVHAVTGTKKFQKLADQDDLSWPCIELIHFIHSTAVTERGQKSAEARQTRYEQVRQMLIETSREED